MKPAYLLAIVSGILLGTSYIPFPPWAIFFAWVPLWAVWLRSDSYKRVFLTGWLTSFTGTMIGFSWVSYTVHEFGFLPWPIAVLVGCIFGAFANLYMPLAGVMWLLYCRKLKIADPWRIAALPVFMGLGERMFPMIFQWNFGYTWLYAGFPAAQLGDLIGFQGLATVTLLFNGVLTYAVYLWSETRARALAWLASVPAVFALLNVWGHFHIQGLPAPDSKLNFLIVQANIGNQDKLLAEQGWAYRDTVINRFMGLTRKGTEAGKKIDYAVWPETAFPEIIDDPALSTGYAFKLRQQITALGIKLITGGYGRLEGTGQITNSFFVLDERGRWLDKPYHKTVLLAFGEYFPGAEFIPKLKELFPQVGDFGRGPGPTVLTANGVKIGAQICYEGLFDWFTRQLALSGAEVLVNLTNDSWYGKYQQPPQHLYMTLARAIEVRRPLVRSTNTGISSVVLANGDILQLSPLHQEWFYLYEVPYAKNPGRTVFMTWGFWLMPGFLWLGLFLIGLRGSRSGQNRNSHQPRLG